MSKDIENKVVSMEFDNSKFEKPAKETMSTLDKLKQALHFKNVSEGFDAMQKGIKAVTFAPIEKGIDSVYAKFTFMERFTIQFYDRLANKIINTGKMIASETFTRPISTGKAEYEEKMGAVQTIMASSKKSLAEVNEVLAELNKYADDTIYSFKDMTTSIGKFTNAGVKLEDAVAAIKGISNEAALSGANANEASRAMYNFAQALSSGAVKLIDWKSIENANMATKEFKEELIETAVSLGKLTKQTDGFYKTTQGKTFNATARFNDALQDQWMTSEVLITTLKKYSSETEDVGKRANAAAKEVKTFTMLMDTLREALQSGWSESWENIIGDFEEAKRLWTDVSGVLGGLIDRMSQARNALLKFWKEYGGRTAALTAISNIWKSLTKILGAVRDAFRNVFPPMTGRRLVEISKNFEAFTRKLIPSEVTLRRIQSAFKGFFSIIGIGVDAVKALFKVISSLFGKLFGFASGEILKSSASLGEWIAKLRQTIKEGRVFETIFGKMGAVLSAVGSALKAVYVYIKDVAIALRDGGFKAGFEAIKRGFLDLINYIWKLMKQFNPIQAVKNLGKKIADAISKWPIGKAIVDVLTKIKNAIVNSPVWKFCVGVVQGFVNTIQAIINKFRSIDTSPTEDFTNNVKKGFGPLEAIKKFFTAIWKGIVAVWSVIGPTIKAIGKQIGTAFTNLFNGIKGVVNRSDLGDAGVFGAGTGLGLLMTALAKFTWDLGKTVKGAVDTLKGFKKLLNGVVDLLKGLRIEAYARAVKDIGVAIALLAGSMWLLAALPNAAICRATAAIMFLFKGLSSTINSFSVIKGITDGQKGLAAGIVSVGMQLMMLAAAVTILVANLAILALLPYGALVKGFAMLILMLRAISHEVIKMTTEGGEGKVATAMISLGIMIQMLTVPLLLLGALAALNFRAMIMAVGGIIAIIAVMSQCYIEMSKASKETGGFKAGGAAASIAAMGAAILAAGIAIGGLAVISALLTKWFKAENALKDAAKLIFGVIWRLGVIALAMAALSAICSRFNKVGERIQTTNTIKNGKAVTATDTLKVGGTRRGMFFPVIGALLGIGVAMVAVSGAIAIVALAAKGLRSSQFDNVMSAIYKIITMLGIFTVAVAIISKASNKIGDMGNATLSISLFPSMAAYIFAASAFVIAVAAAAKMIHSVDGKDLKWTLGIIGGVLIAVAGLSVLSGKFEKFGKGFTLVSRAFMRFARAALYLGIGVGVVVASLAMLSKMTGGEVDKMADNLDKLVEALNKRKDSIVNAIAMIVQTVIEAIVVGAGRAVTTTLKEIVKVLNEVFDEIIESGPKIFHKMWQVIGMLLDSIVAKAPEITEKLVKAIIAVIKGLGEAIDRHSIEIVEAINKTIEAVLKVIIGTFARLFGVTKAELEGFINNLMPIAKKITTILIGIWAISKIQKASDAVLKIFTTFGDKLSAIAASWFRIGGLKGAIFGYSYETTETSKELVRAKDYFKTAAELKNWISEKKGRSGGSFIMDTKEITTLHTVPGLLDKIKSGLSGVFSKVTGFIKAHPVLIAVSAVSLALSEVLKKGTKGITVVQESDRRASEVANKMLAREREYQEALQRRNDIIAGANENYYTYERINDQLEEIVDSNGKIKKGYEVQFEVLSRNLSSVAQLKIGEDGRVKIITDENEALDYQKKTLNDILTKQQQQNKLNALQGEYNEALKKSSQGVYEADYADAKKRYDEFMGSIASSGYKFEVQERTGDYTVEKVIEMYEQASKLINEGMTKENAAKTVGLTAWSSNTEIAEAAFDELKDAAVTFRSEYSILTNNVNSAAEALARNRSFIIEYEQAMYAVAAGAADANEKLNILSRNELLSSQAEGLFVRSGLSNAYSMDLEKELTTYKNKLDTLGDRMTDTEKETYRTNIAAIMAEAKTAGVDLSEVIRASGIAARDNFFKEFATVSDENKTKISSAGEELGWHLGSGLSKGLHKNSAALAKTTSGIIQDDVIDPAYRKAECRSPSKVFERLGDYMMLGLIKGVEDESSDVEKAFNAVAAASVAAYNSAVNSGNSFAWAPLIDTTGIQNGTALLQSQMAGLQNTPLATTMTSKLAASVDTSSLDMDNSRILESMAYISEELGALKDVIANLQVVMDSGQLVGALAPGMDMELGRRTVRKERGV